MMKRTCVGGQFAHAPEESFLWIGALWGMSAIFFRHLRSTNRELPKGSKGDGKETHLTDFLKAIRFRGTSYKKDE